MGGPSTSPLTPGGVGRGRWEQRHGTALNMTGEREPNTFQSSKIFYKFMISFNFRSAYIFLVLAVEKKATPPPNLLFTFTLIHIK